LGQLQQRLDREREQHNRFFPARASDCAGRAYAGQTLIVQCDIRFAHISIMRMIYKRRPMR
jgi:hypothetical protein